MNHTAIFLVSALVSLTLAMCAAGAQTQTPPAAPAQNPSAEKAAPEKPATEQSAKPATEKKPPRLNLDSRPLPLGGALKTPAFWQSYKARFVTAQGRVVDTGNGNISHSEGQGYGMLLAVAANDRETFNDLGLDARQPYGA